MAKNNRPTTSFRSGMVKAHIWTNTTKDGKPFFKVTVERIYKDDTWKRTSSFGVNARRSPSSKFAAKRAG